jgi:hypothetical protein
MKNNRIILDFLKDLNQNNSKEWMDANRDKYIAAKECWLNEVQKILRMLCRYDNDYFIRFDPKKCISRITNNRMYNPNLPLYKDYFSFSIMDKSDMFSPLHISVGVENSFVDCGYHEMTLSGGADKFKRFIDQELIPKLTREYEIDIDRSVICGHSFGGYFTLYYGLKSIEENLFTIKNIVSTSPCLFYNHRYLFEMERNISKPINEVPLNFYISMGSEDMVDDESKGTLDAFEKQISDWNYKGLRIKKAEYSNFGHIDAAVPGFIKGLTYSFEK